MLMYHNNRLRAKMQRLSFQWSLTLSTVQIFAWMYGLINRTPTSMQKFERYFLALGISFFVFLLLSSPVFASRQQAQTGNIRQDLTLQTSIGFQTFYRDNYWAPINISITNNGTNFTGSLEVKTFTGYPRIRSINNVSAWKFVQPVAVLGKALQQITVYAPFSLGTLTPLGFVVTLFDQQDNTVTRQTTGQAAEVRGGDLLIGILSDPTTDFTALNNVSLPHQSDLLTEATLNASTFPDNSVILKNFDIIILDDFTSKTLSSRQITTLQTWVNQGGTLIEVGGTDWQRTLGPLPTTLLPVQVNAIQTLPAGTKLLPVDSSLLTTTSGSPPTEETLATPIAASTATVNTSDTFYASMTLQSAGTTPLIVQAQQGQGAICYVAFDLGRAPLVNWAGIAKLWTTLLLHTQGDKTLVPTNTSASYYNDLGQLLTQGGIVRMLVPGTLLEPGLVLTLLLGYILMLGPLRLLIMRRLKKPNLWAWNITLIAILVFSLLTYSITFYQKKALLTDNTVSLVQLTEGGTVAHILTYHGLMTPNQGAMTLQLTNTSLAFPLSSPILAKTPLPGPTSDPQTNITTGQNQTTLTLPANQHWAFDPLLSERDTQLSGVLKPHLTLHTNRVTGTITNTLATALSDVYLLLPGYFVQVGHIGAGETQAINLPLHIAPLGGRVLADALAKEGGLPAPYFPYSHNAQTHSDFERHMALLAALNGAGMPVSVCGGACNLHTIKNQSAIVLASAPLDDNKVNTSYDPLLIPGAPVTLIGWADQPLDGTDTLTINGTHPGGRHDNFVQMPVSLALKSVTDIPTGFIMGNTVNSQNSQAQFLLPGIYSLLASSLLFEFSVPDDAKTLNRNLNIKIPVQWEQLSGQLLPASSIRTSLYNWQTGSWDRMLDQHGTVTIANPAIYIGTEGQLLFEITNPDNTTGPLIFGKPSLNVVHTI